MKFDQFGIQCFGNWDNLLYFLQISVHFYNGQHIGPSHYLFFYVCILYIAIHTV